MYNNIITKPLRKVRNKKTGLESYLNQYGIDALSKLSYKEFEFLPGEWYYYSLVIGNGISAGMYVEKSIYEKYLTDNTTKTNETLIKDTRLKLDKEADLKVELDRLQGIELAKEIAKNQTIIKELKKTNK